jgi:hypothetical protein
MGCQQSKLCFFFTTFVNDSLDAGLKVPGSPYRTFLLELEISDNEWNCDCAIGYVKICIFYSCRDICVSLLNKKRKVMC